MKRWAILFSTDAATLIAAFSISRDDLILRTILTAAPASIGLISYVYIGYRKNPNITADILTSIGVVVQFVGPLMYLVAVPLGGYYLTVLSGYIEYFPDVAVAAVMGQSLYLVGYNTGNWTRGVKPNKRLNWGSCLLTPYGFIMTMSPIIVSSWAARLILLQTGSYYHLLRSDFMLDSPFYSGLAQLSSHGIFVVAGCWVMAFWKDGQGERRRWLRLATVITALELIWYFPSGSREPVIALAVAVVFAYMFVREAFPMRWILIGVVPALLLISFMEFYRYSIAARSEATEISGEAIAEALRESQGKFVREDYETGGWLMRAVGRLADARSIAVILEAVPGRVPYLSGESYKKLAWILVPRFLYPEKPEMGLPLGYDLEKYEPGGSSPTTLVGEAFLNFGWLGIFMVLPIIGWMSRVYDDAFQRRRRKVIWAVVYVGMAVQVVRLPVQPAATWVVSLLKAYLIAFMLELWEMMLRGAVRLQLAINRE